MNKRSRILLGVGVALITAASLHFTVGERFHSRMHRHYGAFGCGHSWKDQHRNDHKHQAEPLEGSKNNLNYN